ncbi:MAG: hypothetical protein DWQ36_19630 [Acidobacteria bacterium]|nr:MAG: hypothetical protein DWQ30_06010 [Acidobacteriota bacterium]REJ83844.1 MAG: hypothetical protein DWQ30_06025 [Acidobacteriota bacterium]REK03749.1 MAG: hypothetical protein DWQ36_19615 [Acidobacteriota bacterium]REK03752.1 MAG: hypothetical protein DWQ36_19630 [Acidobacteriota bacterium]
MKRADAQRKRALEAVDRGEFAEARQSLQAGSTKRRTGRPRIEFDLEVLERACASFAPSIEELATLFGCSPRTIQNRKAEGGDFAEIYERGMAQAKLKARRLLWRHAESHAGASIFLAKNLLGMADRTETVMAQPLQRSVIVVPEPVTYEEWVEKYGEVIEDKTN